MSVTAVQSRISEIQSIIASLAPAPAVPTTFRTGADFSTQLQAATTGTTAAGASPMATEVIAEAQKYVGMPYVWGGSSPAAGGMDCSGLVQYVYGKFGIDLPRVSADQARSGTEISSMAEAQPGDLVAWDNSSRNVGADHIAIYLGDGKILEAPRTGLDIRVISIEESGHGTPDYIRRVLPDAAPSAAASLQPLAFQQALSASGASTAVGGSSLPVSGVPFADLFNSAGSTYGISPGLLAAMARQESSFNPKAVSPAGAQGLMQLMPGTAAGLGVSNPFDPTQSVNGAASYLRQQFDAFGSVDLALAAYNAGPGNVRKYGGIPPFTETQHYVSTIMSAVGAR